MLYFYGPGEFPELTGREMEDNVFFAKIPVLAELSSYFQHSNKGNLRGEEVKDTAGLLASLAMLIGGQSMSLGLPKKREKSPKSKSNRKPHVLGFKGAITKKAGEGKTESTKDYIRFSDMLNNAHLSDNSDAGTPALRSPREKCNCNCHSSSINENGFKKSQSHIFSHMPPPQLFQQQQWHAIPNTQTPDLNLKTVLTPILESPPITQINLFPKRSKKKKSKPHKSSPGLLDSKF
jgi:hypothetical protein